MRRLPPPRSARRLLAASAIAALVCARPEGDIAGAAPRAAAPPPSMTYQLDDTLGGAPWSLTAGRYADALDASSADDGTTYILDGDQAAIHVLAPDGRPVAVWTLAEPPVDREPVALDVGPDGRVHVLTACPSCFDASAVDRIAPDGRVEGRLSFEEDYADVAVRADGRLYLVRPEDARAAPEPLPAVDVYDAAGGWLGAVRDDAMAVPIRADVAEDGHVYVLHTVPQPPTPGGGGRGGRGPLPPPGPSAAGAMLQEPAEPVSGVMRFDPLHRYLGTVPFAGGVDVAVRDGQAYVSAYGRVHAVGEDAPLSPVVGQRWSGRPALDVAPDGALVAALSHCSFQGVLRYARPDDRPLADAALAGDLDRPALEGPALAHRVHARDAGIVLQAPFATYGDRPNATYYDALPDEIPFTQSLQRWTDGGALDGQLGHCGQPREVTHARDVARDGDDVYVIDGECLIHRPDDAFPAWSFCPQGLFEPDAASRLAAVSADGGRAAVLDLGAGAVVVVDRTGRRVAAWRIDGDGALLPADIALRGDRIWLAGLGQARIQARALDGAVVADWPALDGVRALDVGPEGDVYALGRAGWAVRYAPEGTPRALWPMPRSDIEVTDLSVADDGRVWVPWARPLSGAAGRAARIAESGVWRFAPEDAPPPAGGPGACALRRDKRAAPGRVPLGASVGVALSIDGACPGAAAPGRLAIVFDTSRSMTWDYALERAKAAVIDLLAGLPAGDVEALLVTFDDEPVLESPSTGDFVAVARRVAALRGRGDTRMGAGIDLAVRHLQEGDAPERLAMLVVSDGVPYDQTAEALDRARDAGIDVAAWLWENGEDEPDPGFVQGVIARGGTVHAPPRAADVAAASAGLTVRLSRDGLLQSGVVVDEVPANMRYVEGSARPPAAWDPATRQLTWSLPPTLAHSGVRLDYRLVPLEVGRHPTNVRAEADVVDDVGTPGHLVFPVPEVEVYAPERVFLPIALRQACVRRERPVDVVLVLDTSSSMSEAAAGGGTKLDAARAAARAFVDQLDLPSDRVAVVTFDAASRVVAPLTGDRGAVSAALGSIAAAQGTRIDLGLRTGLEVLAGRGGDRQPALVLLSDGLHAGDPADVLAEADGLRAMGALVYGIGLGDDADQALLARVATTPDRAFHSPSAEDLARIYAAIRERLVCDGA